MIPNTPARHSLLAGLCALLCLASSPARASGKSSHLVSDPAVEITISTWTERLPPAGLVPMTVKVVNHTAGDASWEVVAKDNNYTAGEFTSHFRVAAPAGGTVTASLLVPTMPDFDTSGRSFKNLQVHVNGPGVTAMSNLYFSGSGRSGTGGSGALTPFTALSEKFDDAYGTAWRSEVSSHRMEWLGDRVNMNDAPTDWRGYTGLAQLWMLDQEWSGASEAQRQAMLAWVATGGALEVRLSAPDAKLAIQGVNAEPGKLTKHGMGTIELLLPPAYMSDAAVQMLGRKNHGAVSQLASMQPAAKERLSELVGPLILRGTLIFSFILVFGIVVGPVNLFWFARGRNRPRLFWTTPLISFAGAAVLVAVMLFQDGTGGTGARVSLAVVLPEQKQMAVIQEQYSKTGVLLDHGFDLPDHETTWLLPLPIVHEVTRYGSRTTSQERRNFEMMDSHASGGWFASRGLQSQMLHSVRLNRGGIEFKPGTTPSVISSLGTPLKRLYVWDAQNRLWLAENVLTGQSTPLKPSSRKDFYPWLNDDAKAHMGILLRKRLEDIIPANGPWFFAESSDPRKIAIPTLTSIRWDHDRAFITGVPEVSKE